uniref:Uncharacterized protein n=5 Tax=Nostocales TaxID=1161 RepID=A0A0C1N3T4_9CYAN
MTDMESSESNDIDLDIVIPSRILFPTMVYSIPQNQLEVNAPIKLNVRVVQKNSNSLTLNRFQPFIPELLTPDGQILPGDLIREEVVINDRQNRLFGFNQRKEFKWWRIRHNAATLFSLKAKLFWQNSSLKLKITTLPDDNQSSVSPKYFWYFDVLEAKTYQLRFILNIDGETTLSGESDIGQQSTAPHPPSEMLATPWLNLRLVQPLSTDNCAVEVDGVLFKIEMPESVLNIPPRWWNIPFLGTRNKTDVKLGIRITNNTSTALRFYQAGSIEVTLISDDGQEINSTSEPIRLIHKKFNYYLLQPGENALINLDGMLFWDSGQLQLAIPNKSRNYFDGKGAFDYFLDLKPGKSYQIQLRYRVSERAKLVEEELLEKIWTGWIALPFIEFRLSNY